MSNPRPTCQILAPFLKSGDNRHQLKPQFPNADKDFKAQSDIESQPFKKPRTCEVKPNSTRPMAQSAMLPCNFKTRLCNNFKMGSCHYGQRCRFAHGISDIRKIWPDWKGLETEKGVLARAWNGQHRISEEQQICRLFCNGKKCIYGDKCRFVHVIPEDSREKSVRSISTTGAKHIGGSAQFQWKRPRERRQLCGLTALESGTLLSSKNYTSVSNRRMGTGVTYYKQVLGMECSFSRNKLEKMSRIYADWIEDMPPLVHGSSRKVEC